MRNPLANNHGILRVGGKTIREKVNTLNTNGLVGLGTGPGAPVNSVQVNNPLGQFQGDSKFLFSKTTKHASLGPNSALDTSFNFTVDGVNLVLDKQILDIEETSTDETLGLSGVRVVVTKNPTNNQTGVGPAAIGVSADVNITSGNTKNFLSKLVGINTIVTHGGSGTMAEMIGLRSVVKETTANTVTDMYAGIFQTIPKSLSLTGTRKRIGVHITSGTDETAALTSSISPIYIVGLNIQPHTKTTGTVAANILSMTNGTYEESHNVFAGPVVVGTSSANANAQLWVSTADVSNNVAGAGTISTSGTTVTGTDTVFSSNSNGNTPTEGDLIKVGSQHRLIVAVASATSCTIDRPFNSDLGAGNTFTLIKPSQRWEVHSAMFSPTSGSSSTTNNSILTAQGKLGIGFHYPTAFLDIFPVGYSSANGFSNVETIGLRVQGPTISIKDGVTLTNERMTQFLAPTFQGVAGGGTETITNAATVYIDGAPVQGSNITITNAYALWVAGGTAKFDGGVTFASGPTLTGFTQGSVIFAGSAGVVAQDNAQFFWDDTNFRLGIGTAVPSQAFSIAEKFLVTSAGLVTKVNNIATVGNGVPSEYATVDLTAQAAAISATTLYAVPASGAGLYRISWVATVTQAATTSSVLGGTNGFQVVYTDKDDSVVKTMPGTIVAGVETNSNNSTSTSTISGCYVVSAKASTNIQYQIDYTSVGATPMQFNLHIKLEAL